jgi:hypothetical protein
MYLDADDDGDGYSDRSTWQKVDNSMSISAVAVDVDDDGDSDGGSSMDAIETRSTLKTYFETGDIPDQNRVVHSADSAGASSAVEIDQDGDGHTEQAIRLRVKDEIGLSSSAELVADSDDDGVADVAAEMEVSADSASFRLNGLPPGVPVLGTTIAMTASPSGAHMTVGTATCDGTTWANGSDVNSKENFTAVDGNELLEQIAQLSITRWNYKGNNKAEHIGPTAQDFKAAFGVGANDKTISTIDPSGIALAAIKALNNKMQELDAKTEEITQLRAELDAIKTLLQKQAATKN